MLLLRLYLAFIKPNEVVVGFDLFHMKVLNANIELLHAVNILSISLGFQWGINRKILHCWPVFCKYVKQLAEQ